MSEPESRQETLRPQRVRDVVADVLRRRGVGEEVRDEQVIAEHEDLMPQLAEELKKGAQIAAARQAAELSDSLLSRTVASRGSAPRDAPDLSHVDIPGYKVTREIRRGGQAVVYEAVQASTGKPVAVKVMIEGPFASPREKARFDREAKLLASVDHPHIVGIIDRGVTPSGAEFFTMAYVSGRPLDQYLEAVNQQHGGDAPETADLLRLFMSICDAVNAAHLRGIIHRDLKPSNIIIDDHGQPHILDFGLARTALAQVTDESDPQKVTITGQFIGSLPWSSPEQAQGVNEKIDIRTDVYSLGVILYQLLTAGAFPYEVVGTMHDVLHNILTAEPTPPSKVLAAKQARQAQKKRRFLKKHPRVINPVIEAIVLKALAKRRANRYQSAGELAADIGNYLSGRPTIAVQSTLKPVWRRVAPWVAAVSVVAGLFVMKTMRPPRVLTTTKHAAESQEPGDATRPRPLTHAPSPTVLPSGETKTWTNSLGMKYVRIEPGEFEMGSLRDEAGRRNDETLHKVRINRPFLLGMHEVTRGQFARFVDATGYQTVAEKTGAGNGPRGEGRWRLQDGISWRTPGFDQADDHPAVCIAWEDAQAFCRWLSRTENKAYGLPTEAQWEYACRAGTATRFSFGEEADELHRYANYHDRAHGQRQANALPDMKHDDGYAFTAPVGSFQPNAWGLYDMHGNAEELCADVYKLEPGDLHVMRGGHWADKATELRSACRSYVGIKDRVVSTGFRLVLDWADIAPKPVAVNALGMAFVRIDPGEFVMGSPLDEKHRRSNELAHRVHITKPFLMGVHEVTRGQFAKFVEATGHVTLAESDGGATALYETGARHTPGVTWRQPGFEQGDDHPVVCVSFDDVNAFIEWLNQTDSATYRLPTEAQWEYACRAGSTTRFNFGDDDKPMHFYANFHDQANGERLERKTPNTMHNDQHAYTAPVGSYPPNAWGLHDMHGNVDEWCSDWHVENYPAGTVTDPVGPPRGEFRAVRGGDWADAPSELRSAHRRTGGSDTTIVTYGFRLVRDIETNDESKP